MNRSGMVQEEGELLTRREAAELAGVHMNTIRLWESTGRVHAQKAGNGVVLIPRAELEAIIIQRREGSRTEREHIAELETENRMLQAQLEEVTSRYERLLDEILKRTGGEDRQ